jgi:hypothetical protein
VPRRAALRTRRSNITVAQVRQEEGSPAHRERNVLHRRGEGPAGLTVRGREVAFRTSSFLRSIVTVIFAGP